jgi:hypothetical protein
VALYYRCPRCQALMNIDSKRKFQECKYCGTLCTEDEAKEKIEELGSDEAWDLYYSNEFGGVFEDPQPTAGLAQLSGAPRNLAAKRMVGMEKQGQRSAQNATETGEDKTSRTATQTRVDKSAQLEAELRKEVEEALVEEKNEGEEKEDSLTRVLRAILVLIVLAIYVFLYFISHF